MEFVGPGVSSMTTDFRNGVDVMTTETTCLSSIWRTDEDTRDYLAKHHREEDYRQLDPADVAYYDGCVYVDLSTVKPMIALPFHPSNTYEIDELKENLTDILALVEKEAARISGGRASFTLLDKVQGKIDGTAGSDCRLRRRKLYKCNGSGSGPSGKKLQAAASSPWQSILLLSLYLQIW